MPYQYDPTTAATSILPEFLSLCRHLFSDNTGYLGCFAARRPEPGAKRLDRPIERFFSYPIAAENAAAWCAEQDARGLEVYFCANLLTDRRRVKANAAEVSALWADGDGAQIPEGFPQPTATVESSPGRDHYYWALNRPIPPDQAEASNQRIAYAVGADHSGWDLGQLLRVPGTHNGKYPGRPVVRLVQLDQARTFDPDELDRLLPPLPARTAGDCARTRQRDVDDTGPEPPVRLSGDALRRYRGELVSTKEGGDVDRSLSLWYIGRDLRRGNASYSTIVATLAERDEALGFHRYTDRPAEYARIADKLEDDDSDQAEAAPLPAAPGPGDSDGCQRCPRLEQTIARLQRDNERYQGLLTHRARFSQNKHLRPAERLVIDAAVLCVAQESAKAGLETPDQLVRVPITRIAEQAGVSDDTARSAVKKAEKWDLLSTEKQKFGGAVYKFRNRLTGRIEERQGDATLISLRQPMIETYELGASLDPAELDPERKPHGGDTSGKRRPRCPDCGGFLDRVCRRCGTIFATNEDGQPCDPQDAPSRDDGHDETEQGSTSSPQDARQWVAQPALAAVAVACTSEPPSESQVAALSTYTEPSNEQVASSWEPSLLPVLSVWAPDPAPVTCEQCGGPTMRGRPVCTNCAGRPLAKSSGSVHYA